MTWVRGAILVFLVYFYFLLFSQFTLLQLVERELGEGPQVKIVLAAMALSGIAGSLLAVRFRESLRTGRWFSPLFFACAIVAFAAPAAHSAPALFLLSSVMGLALGVLTVSIAALLPQWGPASQLGRLVGAGTGTAYMVCNLPAVFTSAMDHRSFMAGAVLSVGGLVFLTPAADRETGQSSGDSPAPRSWSTGQVVCMVLVFLTLIWFDSAVFYIIQQTRALKGISWGADPQLLLNAAAHMAAALAGGWLLDSGKGTPLLLVAWAGLAAGALGLQLSGCPAFTFPYVVAVSLYSTALVYMPSLGSRHGGDIGPFKRAALVFAIGGWMGSGMGIGMAENFSRVPVGFILVTALMVLPLVKISSLLK